MGTVRKNTAMKVFRKRKLSKSHRVIKENKRDLRRK